MCARFSDDDVGKSVVNERGEEVGLVTAVEHGTAHVEPDPGITDTIKAKLGWQDTDEQAYPLQEAAVASVTDDEIRLESDLGDTGGSTTATGNLGDAGGSTTATGAGTERETDTTRRGTETDTTRRGTETDTTKRGTETGVGDDRGTTDDELIRDDDDDELAGTDDDDELIGDDDGDDDDLIGGDTR